MFQSSPAIAGGRYSPISTVGMPIPQFQSSPAIAGGRYGKDSFITAATIVSILTRHRWRALRAGILPPPHYNYVSILTRHRWRALQ